MSQLPESWGTREGGAAGRMGAGSAGEGASCCPLPWQAASRQSRPAGRPAGMEGHRQGRLGGQAALAAGAWSVAV